MRLRRTDRATSSGGNRISIAKKRHRDLSGPRADSKHAQGTGVASGEAGERGGGKTEAASGAFGGGVFAEDTGKREN